MQEYYVEIYNIKVIIKVNFVKIPKGLLMIKLMKCLHDMDGGNTDDK